MDNARRHGTRHTSEEYSRGLRDDFNINIKQQSARSPEVNAHPERFATTIKEALNKLRGTLI
jgi:hypothetical protein